MKYLKALLLLSLVIIFAASVQLTAADGQVANETWADMCPPPLSLMQDGVFLTEKIGIMTGEKTWRTEDGGKTWKEAFPTGFWCLAFADAKVGYACTGSWGSAPGLVYKTTDGGASWEKIFEGPIGLTSIAVSGNNIVAGSPWRGNSIWRSADAGATWAEISGAGGDIHSIISTGKDSFLSLNLPGSLYRSTDGGATWKELAKFAKRAHSGRLTVASDGSILVSGANSSALLRSSDDGVTFQKVDQAPDGITALISGKNGLITAGTEKNGLWESRDNGLSWTKVYETSNAINAITHVNKISWAIGGKFGKYGFWPVTVLLQKGIQNQVETGIVPIEYEMPFDGFSSLVIEDSDGNRVRNLFNNQPRKRGKNTGFWDARDEWGDVVPAGKYSWRGLAHKGVHANYQFHFNSPGNPPWRTSDGTGAWGSDHSNPQAAASSGDKVFLGWPYCEAGRRLIAVDAASGRKLWEQGLRLTLGNHYGGNATALAADKEFVYAALETQEAGIGFCRLAIDTGKEVKFERVEEGKTVNEVDHVCEPEPGSRPASAVTNRKNTADNWDSSTVGSSLRGCAVDSANLYISSYLNGKIYVCNKATAANLKTISVPEVAGIASYADGRLLAISAGGVVKIDTIADKIEPLIPRSQLTAPLGIAISPSGNIYISERGSAMRVSVFSSAGKRIGTIGKDGGRPVSGVYDQKGMLLPWGLAVDNTGRIWVAEQDFSPRRISVWRANGEFDREFIGPSTYASTGGAINPDDPTMAIDTGTIFKLNWEKGTYQPVYSLPRMGEAKGAIFGWPHPGTSFKPHAKTRFLKFEGRQFLLYEEPPMVVFELVKGKWLTRAALGSAYGMIGLCRWQKDWDFDISVIPGSDKTWFNSKWPPPLKDFAFIWVDQNGDGLCQTNEFEVSPEVKGVWRGLHMMFGNDLSAQLGTMQIKPSGWSACGSPLYQMADLKLSIQEPKDHPGGKDTWIRTPGEWLVTSGYSRAWQQSATPTVPALMSGYNPSGIRKWTFPSWFQTHGSLKSPSPRPGLLVGDWYFGGSVKIGGDIGEVFHVMGNLGQHYIFTVDGLYLSELFTDGRSGAVTPDKAVRGMNVDTMTNGGEGWASGFFRNSIDKKIYAISCLGSATAPCVSEITGLESAVRLKGAGFSVNKEQITIAKEHPPKSIEGALVPLTITKPSKVPVIDGSLDDWNFSSAVGIPVDEKRGALGKMTMDENNLYIAWKVRDPFPLRNGGTDPFLMFKTGTVLDIMLGTDPAATKTRQQAASGDIRISMTVMNGKAVAVLYRPVAPGATDGTSFSSPNQKVKLDSVHIIKNAAMDWKKFDDGFVFEASIPLSELGWKPINKQTIAGDIGVIYADDTGTKNIMRSYWANKQTGLVSDIAVEATFTPSQWGKISIEK